MPLADLTSGLIELMWDLSEVFATFPVLHTERFILRALTDDDTADIYTLMGDERVTRYLGRGPMASLDEAVQRVEAFHTTFEEETGIPWAITPRGQTQVIGTCLYWHLQKPHYRAEIGYVLLPDWWGQGVMTEVGTAVLDFGFNVMKLHSVEANIDPDNIASRRLLEKLGFVQEGYFRESYFHQVEQRFTDTAILSLLKSSWLNRS